MTCNVTFSRQKNFFIFESLWEMRKLRNKLCVKGKMEVNVAMWTIVGPM